MSYLSDKTAFITGALGGIGSAVAHAFAKHGAHLILHDLPQNRATLQEEGKKLSHTYAINVQYSCFDLQNHHEIQEQMRAMTQQTAIDILVNNAGIQHLSSVEQFPAEQWQKIIEINLSSVFYLSKIILPQMKKNGFGRIINIASVHGLLASIHKAAYVAAKHGVLGLTKTIALETAQTPITANCICPGFVMTPLVARQIEQIADQKGISYEDMKKQFIEDKHPSGQFIQPEDIGEMAGFLAGPYAQEIRGASFVIDGGWSIT